MGKIVAVWTVDNTFGSTKEVVAALACGLGITSGKKVAVTALPGRRSEFMEYFDIRMPEKIRSGRDNNVGFYLLLQKALYQKPGEKMVMEAGIRTINKGPVLFPWFDSDESMLTEKNAVTLIMGALKEIFDYVLIDAGCGNKSDYSELLLKNADFVLVLLPRNKRRWKEYFEGAPLSGTGRFIYVIYPYAADSAYSEGFLSHHFGKDRPWVQGIPLSGAFSDALSDGKAAEFFLEAGKNKKRQESEFFKAIMKLTKGVEGK